VAIIGVTEFEPGVERLVPKEKAVRYGIHQFSMDSLSVPLARLLKKFATVKIVTICSRSLEAFRKQSRNRHKTKNGNWR
jgi:hypothetical protein